MHTRRFIRVFGIIAVFIAGISVGAGYMAFAATTGDTYYACVTSKGDIYRVRVNAKYSCIGTDRSISWNQKGQPGPVGPQGPQGPEGPEGPQGVPGQDAADLPLICAPCTLQDTGELLENRNLADSYVRNASLFTVSFNGSDLSGATFTDTFTNSTSFVGSILTEAVFIGTTHQTITLTNANLTDADFSGADLSIAIMYGATIEGMNLQAANLDVALMGGAVGIPIGAETATWTDSTCPDGTNSNDNGNTCVGHFLPLP